MVLEKTLESPLDCKEIQPVHPEGDQSWVFIGKTDAEVETTELWPPLLSPSDISQLSIISAFAASFFLELLVIALCSFPVAYWAPSGLGVHLPVSSLFAFSYCSWNSPGKNTVVICHSLLQWTMFCQNSSISGGLAWHDS